MVANMAVKEIGTVCLGEISPAVAVDFGFDYQHFGDVGGYKFHKQRVFLENYVLFYGKFNNFVSNIRRVLKKADGITKNNSLRI